MKLTNKLKAVFGRLQYYDDRANKCVLNKQAINLMCRKQENDNIQRLSLKSVLKKNTASSPMSEVADLNS